MSGTGLPDPDDRVAYATAGRAQRQAHDRARASGDLTFADWRTLDNVLDETTSYSKLAAKVLASDLARGVSSRSVRRSLGRLLERGVVVWIEGRGRGRLTVVGVPPKDVKADEYLSALAGSDLSAFPAAAAPKSGQELSAKSGQPARARQDREDVRGVEDVAGEGDVGPRSSRSDGTSHDVVTGSGADRKVASARLAPDVAAVVARVRARNGAPAEGDEQPSLFTAEPRLRLRERFGP